MTAEPPNLPVHLLYPFEFQTGRRHDYQYITASLLGDIPLATIPLRDVQFGWSRNKPGNLSGTFPVANIHQIESLMRATTPGRTVVYVFRDSVPIWGGIIWKRSISSDSREVKIEADTFDSYAFHRILDQTISFIKDESTTPPMEGTDQIDMFRYLWQHMSGTWTINGAYQIGSEQRINSDIGVVLADQPKGTVKRGKAFKATDFKNYGEHLEGLSNLSNGFDWVATVRPAGTPDTPVTPSGVQRRIEFGYPHLGRTWDQTRFIWEFPAALITYAWDGGSDAATTAAYVVGKGEGDLRTFAIKRNTIRLEEGWPLLDVVYNHSTVWSKETLGSHAMKYLRAFNPPTGQFRLTIHPEMPPRFGMGNEEFFIGDEILLRIDDELFLEAEIRRDTMIVEIDGIEVTPNDEGLEEVKPVVKMKGQETGIEDPEEEEGDLAPDDWEGATIPANGGSDITIEDLSGTRRVLRNRVYSPSMRKWLTVEQESLNGGPLSGWVRSVP